MTLLLLVWCALILVWSLVGGARAARRRSAEGASVTRPFRGSTPADSV